MGLHLGVVEGLMVASGPTRLRGGAGCDQRRGTPPSQGVNETVPTAAWRRGCCVSNGSPGYRATSGVFSQAPAIRGSVWVISRFRGTRGTNMDMTNKHTNKDTTMDKVLQGVASIGSERPEECNSGEPKTRVRYSGAARRRYKKQLQREGKATKAQIPPAEADFSPGPSSGGAPTVALKRARPRNNTPRPNAPRQGKPSSMIPRTQDQ